MEDINPSVRQSLLRLSDNLSEIVAYTDEYLGIEQQRLLGEEKSCSIEALLQTKMPRTLLYQWLQNYGFNRVRCNQIYQSLQHDRSNLFLSETHRLFKERGQLYLTGLCKEWSPRTITEGESLVENEQGQQLEMSWSNRREEEVRTSDRCMVTVDADRLQFPLVWRKWRSGDIFQPLGMKGMKKVSDYLSDRKKTSWEKEQITVLCSGDRVVWLVGERLDHRFRVTEETTRLFRVKVV